MPPSADEHSASGHFDGEPGEAIVPELEYDENVAPRPEEEIADAARAQPDVADHSVRGRTPTTRRD